MRKLLVVFMAFAAIVLMPSCEDSNKAPSVLTVDSLALNFSAAVDSQTIQILSDGDWIITSSAPDWCTASVGKGSGNMKVVVSVSDYFVQEPRSANIVLRGDPATSFNPPFVTIEVTQRAFDRGAYFKMETDFDPTYAMLRKQKEIDITVATSVAYTVTVVGGDWITYAGEAANNVDNKEIRNTHKFIVLANETDQIRKGRIEIQPAGDTVHVVKIAQCGYGDREALEALYAALDGDKWMDNDWWCTDVPLHKWIGVRADEEDNVTEINLSRNHMHGVIPEGVFGKLERMERLDLSYNSIALDLPNDFGAMVNLTQLNLWRNDFSGTLPASIGAMSKLYMLDVRENYFSGEVPSEVLNHPNFGNGKFLLTPQLGDGFTNLPNN